MAAKSDNVCLSHGGRENSEKTRKEQGGFPCTSLNAADNSLTHQQGFFMLEIPALAACGWLLMHNPTENLKLPITEWEQSLAFDTAAECETFIATRWVKAEKEHDEFKLERYRCVPADVVYPHTQPEK